MTASRGFRSGKGVVYQGEVVGGQAVVLEKELPFLGAVDAAHIKTVGDCRREGIVPPGPRIPACLGGIGIAEQVVFPLTPKDGR